MNTVVVCEVIILNDRKEILLQLRDNFSGLVGAGKWNIFGGAKNPGEEPVDAIRRELKEELDLLASPEFIGLVTDSDSGIFYEHHLYFLLYGGSLDTLNLHEGQEMRFFKFLDLAGLDKVEWFDQVYGSYVQELMNK